MSQMLGYAVIMLVFGLPAAVYPCQVAKFSEAMDAIGSKRKSSEVEPAGWNVALTRIVGVGFSLFGLAIIASALLG
jgi:hypothetical protein